MGNEININTDEMRNAAKKLEKEKGEMEQAVSTANTSMNICRDMKSKRVARRVKEWDDIQKKFKSTLDEMLQTYQSLTKAAEEFDQTDNSN